jgi:hypothetical protein
MAESKRVRTRSTFLLVTDFERVEEWCRKVRRIFAGSGRHVGLFLVGSVMTSRDYRDIDLRLMFTDDAFDREWHDPVALRYMNAAISTWGQRETGLPIDFQIQRATQANASYPAGDHPRNPMGIRDWGTPGGVLVDDVSEFTPPDTTDR